MLQALPASSSPPSTSFYPIYHHPPPPLPCPPHYPSCRSSSSSSSHYDLPALDAPRPPSQNPFSRPSLPSALPFLRLPYSSGSSRKRLLPSPPLPASSSGTNQGADLRTPATERTKRRRRESPTRRPPTSPLLPTALPPFSSPPLLSLVDGQLDKLESREQRMKVDDASVFTWPKLEEMGLKLRPEEEAVMPEQEAAKCRGRTADRWYSEGEVCVVGGAVW